jgi:hypothetical protein
VISFGIRYCVMACRAEVGNGRCEAVSATSATSAPAPIEPVPPSKIERPLHFNHEDPELNEYLKPPRLPWEWNGRP